MQSSISTLSSVLFLDDFRGTGERHLQEYVDAVKILDREYPDNGVEVYIVVEKLSDAEKKTLNVTKYPTVRVYQSISSYETYDSSRIYAKQIGAFLKRQYQARNKRVSAVLKTLEKFHALKEESDPIVIYCGQESSPAFKTYESIAKDNEFIYYHVLEADFCTRLHIIQKGLESKLFITGKHSHPLSDEDKKEWLATETKELAKALAKGIIDRKKHDEELAKLVPPNEVEHDDDHLNETIWNEHKLSKDVIFVMMKTNDVFQMIDTSTDQKALKDSIKYAAISNFYTDFDKAFDHLFDTKYVDHWYIIFSPKNQTLDESPCSEMYALSKEKKLVDEDVKFGCMSKEELAKFGVEIYDPNPHGHSVYYFKYFDMVNGKKIEGKVSRPFKYKLENPIPGELEKFYNEVRAGKVPKYYMNEPESKLVQNTRSHIKLLTRETFLPFLKSGLEANKPVIILTVYSRASIKNRTIIEGMEGLLKTHGEHFLVGDIDIGINEIDDMIDGNDDSSKLLLFLPGADIRNPLTVMNPTNIDSVRVDLAKHIPALADVVAEEEVPSPEKIDL